MGISRLSVTSMQIVWQSKSCCCRFVALSAGSVHAVLCRNMALPLGRWLKNFPVHITSGGEGFTKDFD